MALLPRRPPSYLIPAVQNLTILNDSKDSTPPTVPKTIIADSITFILFIMKLFF